MQVTEQGSVRVDLVGGTLDLYPINHIIPDVVTINVATSLKAKVTLSDTEFNGIAIKSEDYDKEYFFSFEDLSLPEDKREELLKEMSFVVQIIETFKPSKGIRVELKSGAPAGSGLGGSSAMGVTLYKALLSFYDKQEDPYAVALKVKNIEGKILNRGVPGYQDHFPALFGGVLALRPTLGGVDCEQLYSEELQAYLEKHLTLVYSGVSRNSGISNWDVYKGFFDGEENSTEGLKTIAQLSSEFYKSILAKDYEGLRELISKEGESRKKLASSIVPEEINNFELMLKEKKLVDGIKMCGAGGGGCFLIVHPESSKEAVIKEVHASDFTHLPFEVSPPCQ